MFSDTAGSHHHATVTLVHSWFTPPCDDHSCSQSHMVPSHLCSSEYTLSMLSHRTHACTLTRPLTSTFMATRALCHMSCHTHLQFVADLVLLDGGSFPHPDAEVPGREHFGAERCSVALVQERLLWQAFCHPGGSDKDFCGASSLHRKQDQDESYCTVWSICQLRKDGQGWRPGGDVGSSLTSAVSHRSRGAGRPSG